MAKIYGSLTTVESGDKHLYFIVDEETGVVGCMRNVDDKPTLLTISNRQTDSFRLIPAEYLPSLGFTFRRADAEELWLLTVDMGAKGEQVVDVGGMFEFLVGCLTRARSPSNK